MRHKTLEKLILLSLSLSLCLSLSLSLPLSHLGGRSSHQFIERGGNRSKCLCSRYEVPVLLQPPHLDHDDDDDEYDDDGDFSDDFDDDVYYFWCHCQSYIYIYCQL